MISLPKTAAAATAILATSMVPASSQEQVGQATLIRTSVTGSQGELAVRSPVYRDERLNTSPSGLGEFRFADGTKFAVGSNSSVVVDRFIYDSSRTFNKLTLNAARGSFRWISGKSRSEAYEIETPAGTIGIRGTKLDIYVGPDGLTSVVLLSGRAQFCGVNGCQELRRRCDVVVATPNGGVSGASRVNREIFQTLGSDQAFPFLSGRQRLSRGFQGFFDTGCGISSKSNTRSERGGGGQDKAKSTKSSGSNNGGGGYGGGGGNGGGGY